MVGSAVYSRFTVEAEQTPRGYQRVEPCNSALGINLMSPRRPRPAAPASDRRIPHVTNYNMHDLHANARAVEFFFHPAVTAEIRAARKSGATRGSSGTR